MRAQAFAEAMGIDLDTIREMLNDSDITENSVMDEIRIERVNYELARRQAQAVDPDPQHAQKASGDQGTHWVGITNGAASVFGFSSSAAAQPPGEDVASADKAEAESTASDDQDRNTSQTADREHAGTSKSGGIPPDDHKIHLANGQHYLEPYPDFQARINKAPYAIILGASAIGKSCCLSIATKAMWVTANDDYEGTIRETYRIIDLPQAGQGSDGTKCVLIDIAGESFMAWLKTKPNGGENRDLWGKVFGNKFAPKPMEQREQHLAKYLDGASSLYVLLAAPEGRDQSAEERVRTAASFLINSGIQGIRDKPVTFLLVKADKLYEFKEDTAYLHKGIDLRGDQNGELDLSGIDIDDIDIQGLDDWYIRAISNPDLGLNQFTLLSDSESDHDKEIQRYPNSWRYAVVLHPPRNYLTHFSNAQCMRKDLSLNQKTLFDRFSLRLTDTKRSDRYKTEYKKYSRFIADAFSIQKMHLQHQAEQAAAIQRQAAEQKAEAERQAAAHRAKVAEQKAKAERAEAERSKKIRQEAEEQRIIAEQATVQRRSRWFASSVPAVVGILFFSFLLMKGYFGGRTYQLNDPNAPIKIAAYQNDKPSPYSRIDMEQKIALLADLALQYEKERPELYEVDLYFSNSTDPALQKKYDFHNKTESGCGQILVGDNKWTRDFKSEIENISKGNTERLDAPESDPSKVDIRQGQEPIDCKNAIRRLWRKRMEFIANVAEMDKDKIPMMVAQAKDIGTLYEAISQADPNLLNWVNMKNDRARDLPLIASIVSESTAASGTKASTPVFELISTKALNADDSNLDRCRPFFVDSVIYDSIDGPWSPSCPDYMRRTGWLKEDNTPVDNVSALFKQLPYAQQQAYCTDKNRYCKTTETLWNFDRDRLRKYLLLLPSLAFLCVTVFFLYRRDIVIDFNDRYPLFPTLVRRWMLRRSDDHGHA